MDDLRSAMEEGFPIVLSRNTDVAHWYLPWLRKCLDLGWVMAPHPKTALPVRWSTHPEDVPALVFMTKHPVNLAEAYSSWLSPYRVTCSVTITGWDGVEGSSPRMAEQLEGLGRLAPVMGPEMLKWRYSPVPIGLRDNPSMQDRLREVADVVASVGINEVEISTMQPSPHWRDPYGDVEDRFCDLRTACDAISSQGLVPKACGADERFLGRIQAVQAATCLDSTRINDLFDLKMDLDTVECGCQTSVDPCTGREFGCGSGCEYCYVPETKVGGNCER